MDPAALDSDPLPRRSTTNPPRPTAYDDRQPWHVASEFHGERVSFDVMLWAAQLTIRMHEPMPVRQTRMDPHARWRDVVINNSTTYVPQRCRRCADLDLAAGCPALIEAIVYVETYGPMIAAKKSRAA